MSNLPCDNLLIGASGSIHVIHLAEYLTAFKRTFAKHIRLILTGTAATMVHPEVLELHLDEPVYEDLLGTPSCRSPHVTLTRWADVFLVLPATAGILGKAANGIADDLLSTSILATPDPVIFAPGMNPSMWSKAPVRRNIERLRADGHCVIEPAQLVSVTTGRYDIGYGPTLETVLPQLWHNHMVKLRKEYWAEATSVQAQTPSVTTALPLVAASMTETRKEAGP